MIYKSISILLAITAPVMVAACGEEPKPTPVPPAPVVVEAPTAAATPTPTREAPTPTPALAAATATPAPDIEAQVDAYMSSSYSEFSGCALIARGDKVLLSKCYGMADYEEAIPNTPQTVFPIGSITNQFTAAAIMQLQEEGLLDVREPIADHLPDYPNGENITVHHLLNHTSGIPDYYRFLDTETLSSQLSSDEVMDLFRDEPLDFIPGERFSYSNSGYVLLGYLIEKLSGRPYQQFLKENIFQPLGMPNTAYDRPGDSSAGRAQGYNSDLTKAQRIDITTAHGSGALASTTGDLYLWSRALSSGGLLAQDSIDMMFTPYVETVPYDIFDYGYGWYINTSSDPPHVLHGGGFPGYQAIIRIYGDNDVVVIMLGNTWVSKPRRVPKMWTASGVLATIASINQLTRCATFDMYKKKLKVEDTRHLIPYSSDGRWA